MLTESDHRLINNDLLKNVGAVACGVACIHKIRVADVCFNVEIGSKSVSHSVSRRYLRYALQPLYTFSHSIRTKDCDVSYVLLCQEALLT